MSIKAMIKSNVVPGAKTPNAGIPDIWILKTDHDPSSSGLKAPLGTIVMYEHDGGVSKYVKTGDNKRDWTLDSVFDNADQLEMDFTPNYYSPTTLDLAGHFEGIDEALNAIVSGDPQGVIVVAKSGGSFTTIAAGLAAASSGDIVFVYPGTYAESITIPAGVRLVGHPSGQSVIISGSNTTSTRVIINDTSTLREITVQAPSSGSNPAIDISGLGSSELAVLYNVNVIAAGGSGPLVLGAGDGELACLGLYHNGGTTTGPFLSLTGGVAILNNIFGNLGTASDLIKIVDTDVNAIGIITTGLWSGTDGIEIGAGSSVQISSMMFSDFFTTVMNALHITDDDVKISILDSHLHGTSFDILVDSGLTGVGSEVSIMGEYRTEKFSVPAAFKSNAIWLSLCLDDGIQDDPNIRIAGSLSSGDPDFPTITSMGEGAGTTKSMTVLSFNGTATYVDNTAAAKSLSGSTFDLFQGTTSGNIAYFGNSVRKFTGLKVDVTTAMVLGSGAGIWEYWNGSSWTTLYVMATEDIGSATQYAQSVFVRESVEQIRFGTMTGWATTSVNGTTAYWIRYRLTGGITTVPVLERVLLGTNRSVTNTNGFLEYFGNAEQVRPLFIHLQLIDDLSGLAPGNGTINYTSNISLIGNKNRFSAGAEDGFGWARRVPNGLQTAKPITFRAGYVQSNNNTGNMVFRFRYQVIKSGNVLNGSITETTLATQTIAGTGVASELNFISFSFTIPDAVPPNDIIVFSFARLGNNVADTYTGTCDIAMIDAEGFFWR